MPLRAKILDSQATQKLQMSSNKESNVIKELPGDEPEDVLFDSLYGLRTIELNRPKKLNSLNGSMIRKIVPRLQEWEKSDMANVVVMKGAGEKSLCAGGDVAVLAQMNKEGAEGQQKSTDYFSLEYKLDHLIATYKKPYIAFMDGITMGGGVGLSVHAPFRIATEKTVFAMPETTIGFFPDVGASFFLPRMNGATGTYLALTSERLKGVNVFYSGIATHYLHSTSLPNLESRLAELRFKDYDSLQQKLEIIDRTIEEYATGLPPDEPIVLAGELRKAIDRCFSKGSIGDILAALKAEQGPTKEWAEKTIATLHARSPTAVHVTLRQMQIGGRWSIAETFQREQQIAAKFMKSHDFTEGVDALLIRKTKPTWEPSTLENIRPQDNVADPFFEADPAVPSLELLVDRDYSEYPHKSFGLPTEKAVQEVVSRRELTQRQVVNHFVAQKNGRQGVREVVEEIVSRRTQPDTDDKATWNRE